MNTKRLIKVMGAVFGAFSVVSAANGMQNLNEPEGACCYTDQAGALVCDMLTEHVCMNYMGVWSGAYVPCTDVDCADNDPGEGALLLRMPIWALSAISFFRTNAWVSTATSTGGSPLWCPTGRIPSLEDMGACCAYARWLGLRSQDRRTLHRCRWCLVRSRFRLQRSADLQQRAADRCMLLRDPDLGLIC